jgi:hypothetical protein
MGRADLGESHPISNEWRGGGWSGPSLDNLHESQTFSTSSLLQVLPERQYSKKFFFGVAEGSGPSSVSALSRQRMADPTYKGKSLLFLSLGAHLDTRCPNYCPAQSGLLLEISSVCNDDSPVASGLV